MPLGPFRYGLRPHAGTVARRGSAGCSPLDLAPDARHAAENRGGRQVRLHFGEFVLDRGERVLVRGGIEQALEPKVFDCLALLVAHAGKLTSMEHLRATLWPDVSVGEGALRRVINEARKALGDTGTEQSLIRTRKGVGYVFVGDVRELPPA